MFERLLFSCVVSGLARPALSSMNDGTIKEDGRIKRRNAVSACKSLVRATARNLVAEILGGESRFQRDAENHRQLRGKRKYSNSVSIITLSEDFKKSAHQ